MGQVWFASSAGEYTAPDRELLLAAPTDGVTPSREAPQSFVAGIRLA